MEILTSTDQWLQIIATQLGAIPPVFIPPSVQYQKITLTTFQIQTLWSAPVQIFVAPAGTTIMLFQSIAVLNWNSVAFSNANLTLWSGNPLGAGVAYFNHPGIISAGAYCQSYGYIQAAPNITTDFTGIYASADSDDIALGDSTIDIHLFYSVIQL